MATAPVSHRSSPQTPTRHRRSRTGQIRAALRQLPRGAATDARRLSASEVGLTNVLREVARDDLAIEADLVRQGKQVLLPEGKRGRVDLLLQRTLIGPNDQQSRLVVELKRPSIKLGDQELTQVKRYARALTEHPGVGQSQWSFWLVGADIKDELTGDLTQKDRGWGHVISAEKYDLRVATWGNLLD